MQERPFRPPERSRSGAPARRFPDPSVLRRVPVRPEGLPRIPATLPAARAAGTFHSPARGPSQRPPQQQLDRSRSVPPAPPAPYSGKRRTLQRNMRGVSSALAFHFLLSCFYFVYL